MNNYNKSDLFDNKKLFIDDITGVAQYVTVYCNKQLSRIKTIADDVVSKSFKFNLRWDMEKTHEPVVFKNEIDWCFQPSDDLEWVFAFNRMRYWICLGQSFAVTGDAKYAKAFTEQLTHWVNTVKHDDPKFANAWRSIEAGLRLEYWLKAIRYFEKSEYITDEFCNLFINSVIEHCEYIIDCYDNSFRLLSNWGVLENHGLFLAGVMLPQTEKTLEYRRIALERLTNHIRIQLYNDGVHWEQSSMYHNEVLHCFIDVKILADRNKIPLSKEFNNRLHKMVWATVYHKKPDNTGIMSGDSDEIDVRDLITKAAYLYNDGGLKYFGYNRLDFDCIWDLGLEASRDYDYIAALTPVKNDIALNESGNYYLHNGYKADEAFLHFFCGPQGGSHGHNDCLHIDLFANGEDILVDAGRYTYVSSEIRYELKKSSAHNLIAVDGKDYIEWQSTWHSDRLGKAINNKMFTRGTKEQYTYLEGGSLGYYDNCGDSVFLNRKIIYIRPDIFIIIDEQYTAGSHSYEQFFHFNENGNIEMEKYENKAFYKSDKNKTEFIFSGSDNIENNSFEIKPYKISRQYNRYNDNKMLVRSASSEGFCSLATAISVNRPEAYNELYFEKLSVTAAADVSKILPDKVIEAYSIKKANRDYVLVIAHQDYSTTGCFSAGGCTGFGQAVIFDVARDDTCIGQVLI